MKILTQDEIRNLRNSSEKEILNGIRVELERIIKDREKIDQMMAIYSENILEYASYSVSTFVKAFPDWSQYPELPFADFVMSLPLSFGTTII
jgi:hypothetical protein